MKFNLNLATRTYINRKRFNTISAVVSVVLAVLLLVGVQRVATHVGEISSLNDEIAVLDGRFKSTGGGISEKDYSALLKDISAANSIIEKKTYDWLWLLDRLEEVLPEGVSLTSVEPVMKDQSVKLSGTARGFGNLRVFLENLEASAVFSDMFLVNQAATGNEKSKGITFGITARVKNPTR